MAEQRDVVGLLLTSDRYRGMDINFKHIPDRDAYEFRYNQGSMILSGSQLASMEVSEVDYMISKFVNQWREKFGGAFERSFSSVDTAKAEFLRTMLMHKHPGRDITFFPDTVRGYIDFRMGGNVWRVEGQHFNKTDAGLLATEMEQGLRLVPSKMGSGLRSELDNWIDNWEKTHGKTEETPSTDTVGADATKQAGEGREMDIPKRSHPFLRLWE